MKAAANCSAQSTSFNLRLPRTPSMRHHKATGQGYVVLNGKAIALGKYGQPDTLEKYHQAVAEWLSCNRQLPTQQDHITVKEMLARFWVHAQEYYRHANGTPTSEVENLRQAMRPLKQVYANNRVIDFGPRCLRTVRQTMIDKVVYRYSPSTRSV